MGWADYGFPDVTMITNYTAMKALHAAFRERLIHTRYYDVSEDYIPELFKEASPYFSPYPLTIGWDIPNRMIQDDYWGVYRQLQYINQFVNLDAPIDPQYPTEPGYPLAPPKLFLNESIEIKKIIEERDTTGIGYIGDKNMLPEWSKAWIEQRYLAYNLTKLLEVPLILTVCRGEGNSKFGGTAQDAFENAKANTVIQTFSTVEERPYIDRGSSMYTTIQENHNIYGVYYTCDFYRVLKIDIDYNRFPSFVGLPAYIYVSPYQSDQFGVEYVFDNHGFPIREGLGMFTKIPLPWENFDITPPNHGLVPGNYGYFIRGEFFIINPFWQYGVVDASSWFEFYANVDNP